jgi:hypothetical protein
MAAPLAGGIAFEGTAQIADPLQLADALSSAFERAGGERRHEAVEALVADSGRLRVRPGNGSLRCWTGGATRQRLHSRSSGLRAVTDPGRISEESTRG